MKYIISALLLIGSFDVAAVTNPWYLGGLVGYGSTTWEGLVPSRNNQNEAMSISTPLHVHEGGNIWGIIGGYDFLPAFGIELNYSSYPNARVFFDRFSLFSFENDNKTSFVSRTSVISAMAKISVNIPYTVAKAYSAAGIARLYRKDINLDHSRLTPTFGVGLDYPLGNHMVAGLNGNYVAGFGESQINPAKSYLPFLYSISGRLAYRF